MAAVVQGCLVRRSCPRVGRITPRAVKVASTDSNEQAVATCTRSLSLNCRPEDLIDANHCFDPHKS
jgi:hypothetical protein